MKRRTALTLACALAAGCSQEREAPRSRRLLRAARDFGEGTDDDEPFGLAELQRLASAVERAAPSHPSPLVALSTTVFGSLGFAREVEDRDLGFMFLPSVLRRRRGGCVGLGLLYVSLAELIGLRLECVIRPGHLYVRAPRGGRHENAELLRRGEAMPDDWYENRFPIPGGGARAYGRGLTEREVLGVVAYNVGNDRQASGRLDEARRAYQRATLDFPDLAEAHASLGRTLHLLGALDAAELAYAAAARAHPALPGIQMNRELLRRERAGR